MGGRANAAEVENDGGPVSDLSFVSGGPIPTGEPVGPMDAGMGADLSLLPRLSAGDGRPLLNRPSWTVTVLAENTAGRLDLIAEHGLSFWIETPGLRVLFDTGPGPGWARNAEALGIDPARAEAVALSHGHYDHTGGLVQALRLAPQARLYLHPGALVNRYSFKTGQPRSIGIPDAVREAVRGLPVERVRWTPTPTLLAPGVGLTGTIPRATGYEDTGGSFYRDEAKRFPDPIDDDQALWLETSEGVVVVLGCAHAGVVNTLEAIRAHSGGQPFRAVLGGMHLETADETRLYRTVADLKRLEVQALAPCHCTGAAATARLRAEWGARGWVCAAGTRFEF